MSESKSTQISPIEILKALGEPLPESAEQHTKGSQTHKSYDTDGYGYQAVVDRFNEVLGVSWGFTWEILKETAGKYSTGKPYYDITVLVKIWIETPENIRACVGGHIANLYSDALKGAITNAFKKTAAFWGPGRQAYLGMLDDDNKPLPEEEGKDMRKNGHNHDTGKKPADEKRPQGEKKPQASSDLKAKIGALCMYMADGDKTKAEEYYHNFADFENDEGKTVKAPALDRLTEKWAGRVYGALKKQYEALGIDSAVAIHEYGGDDNG